MGFGIVKGDIWITMPYLMFNFSILDCAALEYTYCVFQFHQVYNIDLCLSFKEGFASALASLNHSLVMEHQNEKTPRELEENEESSPFLPDTPPTPPPPSYISHIISQPATSIPFMYTSPRASSESSHSSYREIKVAEFSPDAKERRKWKARLIVVGAVSVVAVVIALSVFGGVYAWGRRGNADVGY